MLRLFLSPPSFFSFLLVWAIMYLFKLRDAPVCTAIFFFCLFLMPLRFLMDSDMLLLLIAARGATLFIHLWYLYFFLCDLIAAVANFFTLPFFFFSLLNTFLLCLCGELLYFSVLCSTRTPGGRIWQKIFLLKALTLPAMLSRWCCVGARFRLQLGSITT